MIGRQISHFYIIRALGSGGMGEVYEAQDTRLPRSVAIKLLREPIAQDLDAIRRLKREARLASSLNHPNICTILDVDEGDGQSFIAMELLHGRTLKAWLAEGRLPFTAFIDIVEQVVDGLAAAHEQGIIHRDITPGNIFVTDGGLVKLLDFGLAKSFASLADVRESDDLTAIGTVAGTAHYMAPERLDPDGRVDYRCDLFSVGVVLYQMATGTRPFDLEPRSALFAAIREQSHVPLHRLSTGHPSGLDAVIDKLLAKNPDDRYPSARALRDALALVRATSAPAVASNPHPSPFTSVAVLPFEIIGTVDNVIETFRDGLAAQISSELGAQLSLRVAPRTSVRALGVRPIRQLGEDLGVETILEGTVQQSAGRVRVTSTLVEARAERSVLPPVTTEHRCDDLLDAQAEVAQIVCAGMRAAFSTTPSRPYAPDPEAIQAFQRAQHHWRSCFAGGWRPAIEHLQYALTRDSRFLEARVTLAAAYNFLGFYCVLKPSLAFQVARQEAEHALAVDANLASAHVERALATLGGDWDWEESENAFRRALTIDPANPLAHVYYSWLLVLLGRDDAAFSEAQKGHALAPSSRLVTSARAHTLYLGARYDEAIEVCSECLRADPRYVFAVHLRGLAHLALSKQTPAVADLEAAATLSHRAPFYLGLLGRCYGFFGMRAQAEALLVELGQVDRDTYVPPQAYVYILAGLGQPREALGYQEQAYLDGASPFNYLTPSLRDFYALDPYHKTRLDQMRLTL